jgi:hypothetical protein
MNTDESRLTIRGTVDGRHPVNTLRETAVYWNAKDAADSGSIYSLKKTNPNGSVGVVELKDSLGSITILV